MVDVPVAVETLIKVLVAGGTSAATELFKGAVLNGAKSLSHLWRTIFADKPESRPLADTVAKDPQNAAAQQALCSLLEDFLKQNPSHLQQIQQSIHFGDVKAEGGSVVVGVLRDGNITVINK